MHPIRSGGLAQRRAEVAQAGVSFPVAVGAGEHALRELSLYAGLAPRDTVHGDAELLFPGVEMVELESVDGPTQTAAQTDTACGEHGSHVDVLSVSHHGMAALRLGLRVTDPMAVRTDERALVGLALRPFDASHEATERELLRRRIAMVELQRPDGSSIAAVFAAAAARGDELGLQPDPAAAAVRDPRPMPTDTWILQRTRGRVVRSERRATRAESPATEDAHLAVDRHAGRERIAG